MLVFFCIYILLDTLCFVQIYLLLVCCNAQITRFRSEMDVIAFPAVSAQVELWKFNLSLKTMLKYEHRL